MRKSLSSFQFLETFFIGSRFVLSDIEGEHGMYKTLIEHIQNHIKLSDQSASRLVDYFESKEINKKEYLLKAGAISRFEYFIVRGCLRVFVIDAKGVENNIRFGTENWWIGDFTSFLKKEPASYFIQAIEKTEVLLINRIKWDRLFSEIPEIAFYFHIMFQNAALGQQSKIAQHISYTPEQRYQDLIEKRPELLQRVPQKYIASYLGITPEFLSMIRKKISTS
ncbi:Crp/Fnr family transcriptional regulator [Fulvivirgaceae bacterium BMA10]|uniref:Crp/Fnr family transcriptional regulator n=1 Tax=Splendidivirga corallicola TaxID=3051826 RepID=A0ABT8KLU1_9BACT|nr:Crp/Fnr family transcriptional regulator [Fulvivirgaceae bacterium BMA10]